METLQPELGEQRPPTLPSAGSAEGNHNEKRTTAKLTLHNQAVRIQTLKHKVHTLHQRYTLCTLNLLACHVRVSVGESRHSCVCVRVTVGVSSHSCVCVRVTVGESSYSCVCVRVTVGESSHSCVCVRVTVGESSHSCVCVRVTVGESSHSCVCVTSFKC